MLTFKREEGSYRYFAYEVDGAAYIQGLWMNGLILKHEPKHQPLPIEKDLKTLCQNLYSDVIELKEISIEPGVYHPRIWRGPWSPVDHFASLSEETRTVIATSILVTRLRDIFRYVEPHDSNRSTFSHEIRALLLLAAMEVEASFTAILRVNGYKGKPREWKMDKDYYKLERYAYLSGYQVRLLNYPEYPTLRPFGKWAKSEKYESLEWWSNHNHTKHDRDTNFSKATLHCAIEAVGAAAILLVAQFGSLTGRQAAGSLIASELLIERINDFPDDFPSDFFYVPGPDKKWTEKKLFTEGNSD